MFIVAKRNYLVRRLMARFTGSKRIISERSRKMSQRVSLYRERSSEVILQFRAELGIENFIRRMMRRPSRQQNMISVRTQRNRRRKKTLRSL
ncbi:hypothetical protein DXB03_12995 [Lachnospiraceae bacterium OF11-28]|nr:hypothetical protein DXB03_12995 [Lachnospiraceae bacterium OF11-28]